jgi:hypothetical protein
MRRTSFCTSTAAAAAVLLAACSHDLSLEVPIIPSGPVVQSLRPTAAFSGQVVQLRGTGFDQDASSNVVVFPGATARAFAFAGSDLLVRVPPDAGSGNVSVTNSLGSSAPVSGFDYQGLGQLRDLRIVQQVPLLHAPRRLFSTPGVPGRLLADSILVSGVLDVDDPAFFVPGGARQVPSVGSGAVYTMDFDGVLRRRFLATGEETSRAVGVDTFDNVVHVSGKLLALGPSPNPASDRLAMWTLDAATLATTTASPVDTTAWISSPPQDLGDGRAAFPVLVQPGDATLSLGLVDVSGTAPTYQSIDPVGLHTFDRDTVAFAVGQGPRTLAAGSGPLGAVGLSNGDVAMVDLTSNQFEGAEIKTHSPDPIHALLFVPASGQLLAAKPSADVVIGIDLALRKVAWSVSTTRPTRMTLHTDGLVYVASDADDRLVVIDPTARAAVSARSIAVRPGTDDGYGGVTFMPASDFLGYGTFLTDAVYFPTAQPRRTVRYALGDVRPIVAATKDPANFGFSTPDWTAWSASDRGIEVLDTSICTTTAAPPRRVAARGSQLLVATGGGVSVVESSAGALAKWDGVTTLPFASVEAVGYAPSGSPWVVGTAWRDATGRYEDILLGWSLAGLEAGSNPSGIWFGGTGSALVLEDGLWCFSRADAGAIDATAYLMNPAWNGTSAPAVGRAVEHAPIVANGVVSPNGRTFVHWNTRVSPDFRETADLYVRAADGASGFHQVGFFGLSAKVAGVAFDAAGERLFVVTRDPDQLLVIE